MDKKWCSGVVFLGFPTLLSSSGEYPTAIRHKTKDEYNFVWQPSQKEYLNAVFTSAGMCISGTGSATTYIFATPKKGDIQFQSNY